MLRKRSMVMVQLTINEQKSKINEPFKRVHMVDAIKEIKVLTSGKT